MDNEQAAQNQLAAMIIFGLIGVIIIFSFLRRKKSHKLYEDIYASVGLTKTNSIPTLGGYSADAVGTFRNHKISAGYYRTWVDPAMGSSKYHAPDFAIEVSLNAGIPLPEMEISTKNAVTAIGEKIGITTKTGDSAFDQKMYIPGEIATPEMNQILNGAVRQLILRFPGSFTLTLVNRYGENNSRLRYVDNGFRPINSVKMFQETIEILIDIAEQLEKS